jgi:hypothetical protein
LLQSARHLEDKVQSLYFAKNIHNRQIVGYERVAPLFHPGRAWTDPTIGTSQVPDIGNFFHTSPLLAGTSKPEIKPQ